MKNYYHFCYYCGLRVKNEAFLNISVVFGNNMTTASVATCVMFSEIPYNSKPKEMS